MNFKIAGSMLALTFTIGSHPAGATVADFDLAGSGYSQDSPVASSLFESVGLLLSGGVVTACGGECISSPAATYLGSITGSFVVPNTVSATTANSLTFYGVTGNGVISLYDA